MKKLFFSLIIFLTIASLSTTYAQYDKNWALGFRVGEPLGINVRKYSNGGENALDLNIGTYGFIYNQNVNYNGGSYQSVGLAIQVHYLWNQELFGKDYIHWYYGFGGQINSRKFYEEVAVAGLPAPTTIGTNKISLGASGTAGVEFKLPDSDLAIFVDAALYLEALPAPFHYNPGVSAGIRLNLVK